MGNAGQEIDGYSFSGGLLIVLADAVFFSILGCYLDQVIPTEFGVAKPWNFMCLKNKHKVSNSEKEEISWTDP